MKLVVIHMNRYSLKLLKKEKVAGNAWAFSLEQPHEFEFQAGQYVRIYDPTAGESVFRDFTIASSPLQKAQMLLIIKEGISDYKKNLFSVRVGEELLVDAPLGRFVLQEENNSPLVFIAGGVGITPFYSMIQEVIEKKLPIPITLIASFARVEDLLFFNELQTLERNTSNMRIVYTVTQPEKSVGKWNFDTGRVSDALIKKYVKDSISPIFFISGSPSFVIDMESLLASMKINSRQIRVEVFLGFN